MPPDRTFKVFPVLESDGVKSRKKIVGASGIAKVVTGVKKLTFGSGQTETGGSIAETIFAAISIGDKTQFSDDGLFKDDNRAGARSG